MVLKHVEGRNTHLTDKIKSFIEQVDRVEKIPTNWNSTVPKTATLTIN
jgi:hypothetical protein